MTKARTEITRAVEAKGYSDPFIEWEPIGQMVEMSGRSGGWSVFAGDQHALGYNWRDVVDFIEQYWPAAPTQTKSEDPT